MATTSTARLLSNPKAAPRSGQAKYLFLFFGCLCVLAAPGTPAFAQTPKIKITDPLVKPGTDLRSQGALDLSFTVSGADITRVRVIVFQIDVTKGVTTTLDTTKTDVDIEVDKEQSLTTNLFKGLNKVQLTALREGTPDPKVSASITVTCTGKKCGSVTAGETEGGDQAKTPKAPKTDSNITIQSPSGAVTGGTVESLIFVKGGIAKLSIAVYDSEKHLVDYKDSVTVRALPDGKSGFVAPELKVVKGKNLIRVFDADPAKLAEKANEALVIVTCDACGKFDAAAAAAEPKQEQKGNLKITSAKSITYGDKKEAKIKVKYEKGEAEAAAEKKVIVEVVNNKKTTKSDQSVMSGKDTDLTVKLGSGENKIKVYEEGSPDTQRDFAVITCEGKCGSDADVKDIAIVQPKVPEGETSLNLTDKSTQDAYVTVAKGSTIRSIQYDVINEGKPVFTSPAVSVSPAEKEVTVPMTLKFLKGTNTIRVYDAERAGSNNDASIVIKCTGENCATDFLVSTIPTNSMNTRAIVGMEQVGASSASSETKPFLDFFFTGPIFFNTMEDEVVLVPKLDDKGDPVFEGKVQVMDRVRRPRLGPDGKPIRVPRFGTWGQIRFSTTPQQTASASVFPSNFVNQVTDPTKVVDLVQSFDYMGGLEFRAFSANGWNWSLILGIRQKSRLFFTFGAGAISPLNASRASAQIFRIPSDAIPANPPNPAVPASPQRAQFVERFGVPPAGKTYVGFVPLERDRFFRQYYFGIRVKTHYCDDDDCTRFKNRFPSIVDFGIGQNEAVTGGELKQNGKRAWVLRVDAFYPLPFREANFIYLYGTALMKIGQGGVRVDNPLFLDTAPGDVQITSTDVFIPPPGLQPSRLNRDYYKIGIGVNLTDLFNRNKTPPQ